MSNTKWNPSVIIALIAVIISCATALISLKESKVLKKQQVIMQEQKQASVWPFVQAISYTEYNFDRDFATFKYEVENKGIGPAILNEVFYLFDGKEIENGGLANAISMKHPDFKVEPIQNLNIKNKVLAQGEKISVIQIRLHDLNAQKNELVDFLKNLEFHANFCYCSVYGDCWKMEKGKVNKNNSCKFRDEIR